MSLKNRNIISKMKRSKVTDYAALSKRDNKFIFDFAFMTLRLYSKCEHDTFRLTAICKTANSPGFEK